MTFIDLPKWSPKSLVFPATQIVYQIETRFFSNDRNSDIEFTELIYTMSFCLNNNKKNASQPAGWWLIGVVYQSCSKLIRFWPVISKRFILEHCTLQCNALIIFSTCAHLCHLRGTYEQMMAYINDHICCFLWHVIAHSCPKFGHGWVITSHIFTWM